MELSRRGTLLVISAPSGGGKSAVLRELLTRNPDVDYSVSYTSRAPRVGEVDGKDYHFVSRGEFQDRIEGGDFYEHAEVHGNLYGTCISVVQAALLARRDIAMDIDVQGGLNIKRLQPDSVLVFLMPPSFEVLEKRLRNRNSDCEADIQLRLSNARREIEHWHEYDYVVVNEDFNDTLERVTNILNAERSRASRIKLKASPYEAKSA